MREWESETRKSWERERERERAKKEMVKNGRTELWKGKYNRDIARTKCPRYRSKLSSLLLRKAPFKLSGWVSKSLRPIARTPRYMPPKRQQILVPKFQRKIFPLKVYSKDIKHIARILAQKCPRYMGSTMARTFGAKIVRG